jgi:hypothetical protein
MGEKVDTIERSRTDILEADAELVEGRKKLKRDRANVGVDMDETHPLLHSIRQYKRKSCLTGRFWHNYVLF